MNALELFREGHDYIEIATHFGTTEAIIERVIHKLRHAERLREHHNAPRADQSESRQDFSERTRSELREIRARRPA